MSFTQRLVQFRSLVRRGFLWIGFAAIFCFALGAVWSFWDDNRQWMGYWVGPPQWMVELVGGTDFKWGFRSFFTFLLNVALPYTMGWIVLELFTRVVPKRASAPPTRQPGVQTEARAADGDEG